MCLVCITGVVLEATACHVCSYSGVSLIFWEPSKHEALAQCWADAGPASWTMDIVAACVVLYDTDLTMPVINQN